MHKLLKKSYELAYANKNLEVITYFDFLNRDSLNTDLSEYDRNQAISSTKRFFENGLIDLTTEQHKRYYQKSLQNCRVSKQLSREILKRFKPDLFVSSHGIYSTWGLCYKVMKDHGVKTLIWDLHFAKRKKMILVDDIIQFIFNDSGWQQKKEKQLDKSSAKQVCKEFEQRLNHSGPDTKMYFNGKVKAAKPNGAFEYLNSEPFVFGLFPNVCWDGNIYERNELFSDLIEWIEFTIEKIIHTDNKLVIRFHPSEATL